MNENGITVKVWVDGSYSTIDGVGVYGAGAVVYLGDKKEPLSCKWADSNSNWARVRNIAGEMLAVMGVLSQLEPFYDKIKNVIIFHDYEGLAKWVNGSWQARKQCSKVYRDFVKEKMNKVPISFQKVLAHSGNANNEMADRLAKEAVKEFVQHKREEIPNA